MGCRFRLFPPGGRRRTGPAAGDFPTMLSSRDRNNFDLLRLVCAGSVFVYHAYALTMQPDLLPLARVFGANTALNAFFIISGFLVFMSYHHSASAADYAVKRIRRIYPAYVAIVALCALGGLALSRLSLADYASSGVVRYLLANLLFLNFLAPSLPGVFDGNLSHAVNGSLWTIRTEVLCYCAVPVVAELLRRHRRATVFSVLYLLLAAAYAALRRWGGGSENALVANLSFIPWHALCFLCGMMLYAFRDEYARARHWLLIAAVAFFGAGTLLPLSPLVPLGLAVIVLYAAVSLPYLGNFARFGDLSYGVYIFHYPVLQIIISRGMFPSHPYLGLLTAAGTVTCLAFLSWHVIEKPFLRRSSHYVIAESTGKEAGERRFGP